MNIYSNIVPKDKVREVQSKTLKIIANALSNTFGPKGSATTIVKDMDKNGNMVSVDRTKDGHTVVKNIRFLNSIERSVQETLTDLTAYIVKEVGDGTTSAVILCSIVFDCLCDDVTVSSSSAADVTKKIDDVVSEVSKRILDCGWECTLDDIYDIALISTNNNEDVAGTIKTIYEEYGMDVYVDVGVSTTSEHVVKEYDGMTMDVGYTNPCFINNKTTNQAIINNPSIYCFKDPIDTPEMTNMVSAIIEQNIMRAYREPEYMPVPTVIFCKKISPDTAAVFEKVANLMNSVEDVPLLIVSDVFQDYLYEDIAKMCGAPWIKKYLNLEFQEADIKAGLAPTPETVTEFCGHADQIVADQLKTKIIRPAKMFNEDGSYSEDYNTMLTYLETELQKCIDECASVKDTAEVRRRLNCFKGNMVDFLVGGLTDSDRESNKAAVEDAILNCRSAAVNGVGYGANFMALKVLNEMKSENKYAGNAIVSILYDAYVKLFNVLYGKSYTSEKDVKEILETSLSMQRPMNIRTNEYDGKVKSSIKSDVIILETINKILTLMYTCNQYLVQAPMHNLYDKDTAAAADGMDFE